MLDQIVEQIKHEYKDQFVYAYGNWFALSIFSELGSCKEWISTDQTPIQKYIHALRNAEQRLNELAPDMFFVSHVSEQIDLVIGEAYSYIETAIKNEFSDNSAINTYIHELEKAGHSNIHDPMIKKMVNYDRMIQHQLLKERWDTANLLHILSHAYKSILYETKERIITSIELNDRYKIEILLYCIDESTIHLVSDKVWSLLSKSQKYRIHCLKGS